MSKEFPLQSVLDLSQMRLEEATRKLGELISGEQRAAERLEILLQYRDEYQARFLEVAQSGIGREQWRNYQHFLDKLATAIDQARQMVDHSHAMTAAGQREWMDRRGRVQAFDTLALRHRARLAYEEGHREQKLSDEHAARLHGSQSERDD